MKTIAHLSDLHFGRDDPDVVEALIGDLAALRPTLVAVSGDLTQRARPAQFRAARAFLDRIPAPWLVVPGNHDVPLWDVARRFLAPLERYAAIVTPDLAPVFADEALYVAGVSTARSLTWKGGRISLAQIEALRARFCGEGAGRLRVLVAHHPFSTPPDRPRAAIAGRSALALRALETCGLDVLLTGHLHRRASGALDPPVQRLTRSVLAFHAGTATSVRVRDEPNSYNWLQVDDGRLVLSVRSFDAGSGFRSVQRRVFERGEGGWRAEDGVAIEVPAPLDAGATP